MRIINYLSDFKYNVPIYGAAADVAKGSLLQRGATPATDQGAAIAAVAGTGASVDYIGILRELLDYSETGETLANGTSFVRKLVEPVVPWRVVRAIYSMTSTDTITATQAVSTTTLTLTSLEDDIDAGFIYVAAGTGAGQLVYITAAASGSCTLKAAFATNLDTTSKLVKVLPRFHQLAAFNTGATKLQSIAAAGGSRVTIMDSYIVRNGREEQLNPVTHSGLTGLSSLAQFQIWADLALVNSSAFPID